MKKWDEKNYNEQKNNSLSSNEQEPSDITISIKSDSTQPQCKDTGRKRKPYPRRVKYKSGMRFHSFVIESPAPTIKTKTGRTYTAWNCICDCGTRFITTTKQVQKGLRKSCGCRRDMNKYKALPTDVAITNAYLGRYKMSAKRRNINWNLSDLEFAKLTKMNCHYCGIAPSLEVKTGFHNMKVNGVDRKNNDIGYENENCLPCCEICNRAKNNLTYNEFCDWIDRIKKYENNGNQ
jgi:hypothetical protein